MTPQEKANELFNRFYQVIFCSDTDKGEECTVSLLAIECAKVCVEESLKYDTTFWNEVMNDLNNM